MPSAWDITQGSTSIYIAVIDTGILPHPDIIGRYIGGYDFISNSSNSNDGDGRDADLTDTGDYASADQCGAGTSAKNSRWHGLHVGGTIAASTNNGVGIAGIDWNAKIVPIRTQGTCGGQLSDIVDAIMYAAGLSVSGVPANPYPAKVINLSLGVEAACSASMQAAVTAAINAGSVVIASAGNSNLNMNNNPIMPAGWKSEICSSARTCLLPPNLHCLNSSQGKWR